MKISDRTLMIVFWKLWKITLLAWILCESTGCDGGPDEHEPCSPDGGVAMTPDAGDVMSPDADVPTPDAQAPSPDATVPTPVTISFTTSDPPSQTATLPWSDLQMQCFGATASADVEIRNLRLSVVATTTHPVGGGLVDSTSAPAQPNYRDIKVVNDGTGQVFFGPIDLSGGGGDEVQAVVLHDYQVLQAGVSLTLCVKLDVPDNGALDGDTLQVRLDPFQPGDIVALVDGSPVALGDIHPNGGLAGPLTTIVAVPYVPSMSYALAPDDTESAQGIVVGGAVSTVLAKYRFTSVGEERTLRKIRMSVHPHAVPGIRHLRLYDGATLLSGPVVPDADGNADFASGLNFVVPADASKTLTVKAELAPVGPADAPSGLDLAVTLRDGSGGTEAGTFEVLDASGNVDAVGDSGDVTGRIKILRKTKPTVSSIPPQASGLANGSQVLARFVVTADAAGDLSVRTISFGTVLTDAGGAPLAIATPAIREVGSGSAIPASVTTYGDAFSVTFADEQIVVAGTSRTFELTATVTGADVSGETIVTTLLGSDPPADGFLWSDLSAIPHSAGSADWMNGDLDRSLPTDPQFRIRD